MPVDAKKQPGKRGRPAKPQSQRKRNNVTLRIRDHLKEILEEAAGVSDRSLSEELEFRLERSVLTEDHMALVFSDPNFRKFVEGLSLVKDQIEGYTGRRVFKDATAKASFMAAIDYLLDPPGSDDQLSPNDKAESLGIAAVKLIHERLTEKPANRLQLLANKLEADTVKKGV